MSANFQEERRVAAPRPPIEAAHFALRMILAVERGFDVYFASRLWQCVFESRVLLCIRRALSRIDFIVDHVRMDFCYFQVFESNDVYV